ncbi:MAG: hypothetical protein COB02_10360 [Candidatus Cloacimonadota bacterium]|nr:MAG: hypothetical protein COB02_10360 [Candidatus Cloacimonadota bacterium]
MVAYPENHGFTYMFDCGVASLLTISDILKLRAVFVTHTHIDHFINFDSIIRHRAGSRNPLTITGPVGIAKNVYSKLLGFTWNLIGKSANCFEIREIIDDETFHIYKIYPPLWKLKNPIVVKSKTLLEQDNIFVNYKVLDHKIPSIAYKLCENDKINISGFPYKGGPWIAKLKEMYLDKVSGQLEVDNKMVSTDELYSYLVTSSGFQVGWAMDHLGTEPNHKLLSELFNEIDILYIEAFFREIDKDYAFKHHHSTSKRSGYLARIAKVKKLKLVHHSRRYLSEIFDVIEEGRAEFEGREPNFSKETIAKYISKE